MNYQKKFESQNKRIELLHKQIEKLKVRNEMLEHKNSLLENELEVCRYQLSSIKEIKNIYTKGLDELHEAKEKYIRAANDAKQLRQEFEKSMKQLGLK